MQRPQISKTVILPVVLAAFAGSGYASELYGYWLFNETSGTTTADSSGNDLTGTLSSTGATFDPGAGPDGGGAISLSQTDDGFVNMGNPASLAFGGSGGAIVSWTVQAWINTTQDSSTTSLIAGEQVNNVNEGYGIGIGNIDGGVGCTNPGYDGKAVGYTIDGGGGCFGPEFTPPSTTTINDGNWYQLVVVDNSGALSIYVNGTFEGSTGTDGTESCSGADFVVGGDSGLNACSNTVSPVGDYTGLVSDVGVWDVALTSSQIEAAYLDPNNPLGYLDSTTPEPASFALAALGLGALCAIARCRYSNPTRRSKLTIRGSC